MSAPQNNATSGLLSPWLQLTLVFVRGCSQLYQSQLLWLGKKNPIIIAGTHRYIHYFPKVS